MLTTSQLVSLERSLRGKPAHNTRKLQEYFDQMIARGLEGVVVERVETPYQAGVRGFDWVKLKRSYQSRLRDTVDVVLQAIGAGGASASR